MIKSISYSQEEIIKDILNLHLQTDRFDLDPTYSKGNFYKNIRQPRYCFDIAPQSSDVREFDCQKLPFKDEALYSIMFDPPFLTGKGPSLTSKKDNCKIGKRFGVLPTEKELFEFYQKSISEFYRILEPNGFLVFKIQDKVSNGKQYISHCIVHNYAVKVGFYLKDLFILLAKNRIKSGKHTRQLHARKFHSYFMVFEKTTKNLNIDQSVQ